jgi:hypothetical protein
VVAQVSLNFSRARPYFSGYTISHQIEVRMKTCHQRTDSQFCVIQGTYHRPREAKGVLGSSAVKIPIFVWSPNFTVAVRKGMKDTTSPHRALRSIFPHPRRTLFFSWVLQPRSQTSAKRRDGTRGWLTFWRSLGTRTSGRSRALAPLCSLSLGSSHLKLHQPPVLPTRFSNFDFFTFMRSINGSQCTSHPVAFLFYYFRVVVI